MRSERMAVILVAGLAGFAMAGCGGNYVTKQEFDEFKTSVHESGEAVDAWIASAHAYIIWLDQNMGQICQQCAPPNPPPSPPPDGAW